MIYQTVSKELAERPKQWLITGVAGFIGSNLLHRLLAMGQTVVGLDNFITGSPDNLEQVRGLVSSTQWNNFRFIEGDIREFKTCQRAVEGANYVLHQAALGSVPRSIDNPIASNEHNVSGFVNMLVASKDAKVNRFVYAASSSTYGDHPDLPKREEVIGKPLSPYAVTKLVNEIYADVFFRCYGFASIGLRYFNVFGPRQNPNGAYAAVIPKWISALLSSDDVVINGDGTTSRDFCYIENVIQANILAATNSSIQKSEVFNIAVGDRTSLNEIYKMIVARVKEHYPDLAVREPKRNPPRAGDVLHSQASIERACKVLGFLPSHNVREGLASTVEWWVKEHETRCVDASR